MNMPRPLSIGQASGKRVLLTGASGFLGDAIAARLVDSHEVWGLYWRRKPCCLPDHRTIRVDLRQSCASYQLASTLPSGSFDAVIHAAGLMPYRHDNAEEMAAVNVGGTRHLLDALTDIPKCIVYISTADVYGGSSAGIVHHTQSPVRPETNYGRTKLMGEDVVREWCVDRGVRCGVLRPAVIYGAHDSSKKAIASFCRRVAAMKEPIVKGAGEAIRQPIHVLDVVSAIECFLANGSLGVPPCVCLLAGDERLSIRQIAVMAMVAGGLRGEPRYESDGVEKNAASLLFDTTSTCEVLGWTPRMPLADGLSEIIHELRLRRVDPECAG